MMIGLGFMAMRGLDVMILTRFSSIPEVSRYGAALNFTDLITMLAVLVQRALLPVFSRLQLTNTANDLAGNSLSLSLGVLIPACTGLALLADSVVRLYPSGEYDAAGPVLAALSGALLCLAPSIVCASFLTGAGRLRAVMQAYGVAVPVQVGVSLLLVADYAAVGVAIGTLLGYATLTLILIRAARGLGMWIAYRGDPAPGRCDRRDGPGRRCDPKPAAGNPGARGLRGLRGGAVGDCARRIPGAPARRRRRVPLALTSTQPCACRNPLSGVAPRGIRHRCPDSAA